MENDHGYNASTGAPRVRHPTLAPQPLAQRVFALLCHDGAGDVVDALIAQMDAYDGDHDIEADYGDLEDGDVDCCAAGDDNAQHGHPTLFDIHLPGYPDDADDGHDTEQAALISGGGSDAE